MAPRRHKKRKLEKTAGERTSGPTRVKEAPSVYLVVGHEVRCPAYSVFKVDPYAGVGGGAAGNEDPAPVLIRRPLASLSAKFCMPFVPVRSRHGPWIVGVGGDRADQDYAPETIVFDAEMRAVIRGPNLLSTKLNPVLLTIGHKIYALARRPAVKGQLDFVPWFEVLDLSQAQVVGDGHHRLESCEWKPLPRPPFFPWDLTPMDYLSPPKVAVESYVALSSCILLSVSQQAGTHMFDVDKEQWAKLDDENLPFIRGAVPHGHLFLGLSRSKKAITAYSITVKECLSTAPSLSIVEFPVVSEMEEEVLSTSIFLSLGSPGFCSLKSWSDDPTLDYPRTRASINLRAYHTEEPLSQEYIESYHGLLISNQWKQVYKIRDLSRELAWPCLIAAMSL